MTMGMDVYGKAPKNETGRCFRNNVWYWRPLAELCVSLAPKICESCTHWQSNDGDGLDAFGAEALAAVLRKNLADGTIARTLAKRDAELAALPDETCTLCNGTGFRTDAIARSAGLDQSNGKPCNGCEGRGKRRPFETYYPCDVENVTEFADFLEASGGFEIC